MSIYYIDKRKKLVFPTVLTLSLLLSTSGAGALLSVFGWGLYFLQDSVSVNSQTIKINKKVLFLLMATISIIVYIVLTDFNYMKYFNSFGTRVYRGFVILQHFKFENLLVGVGANNIKNFMIYYNFSTAFDEYNLNFATTLTKSFLEYGIVGFLLLVYLSYYCFKKLKDSSYIVRALVLLIVIYFIFEDMLFIYRMGFMFSIVIYYLKFEGRISK